MPPAVLVVFADGFEEIEGVVVVDVLRRAGIETVLAGVNKREITGSHGLRIATDCTMSDVTGPFEGIVLPGGMPGTHNLAASSVLRDRLRELDSLRKLIGAICAAPLVLDAAGVLKGKTFTCYPGIETQITSGRYVEEPVVADGHVVTSRGVGTAIPFALAVCAYMCGEETAQSLAAKILSVWPI